MKTPKIKKFKLSELKAADYNPRVIDDDALEGLANSIERFGCVEPIVVNVKGGTNTIIGGHQRFRALEKLGKKDVICVTVSCSKADEKLLNLSLNNPAIQGQFIEDIGEYIEAIRAELPDDTDYLALRIDQLRGELDKSGEVFQEQAHITLAEQFIVPPFSVFDARQGYWQDRKRAWLTLGIQSELGRGKGITNNKMRGENKNFRQKADRNSNLTGAPKKPDWAVGTGTENMAPGTSIFDPVLCEIIYRWFCPDKGNVLDPFAGGSVRGIVANYLGCKYTGVELRAEQIKANKDQAKMILPNKMPKWIQGDSININALTGKNKCDLIFSCPPYYNLEIYSDLNGELSAKKTYKEFLTGYRVIVKNCVVLLKTNRFACFVVGDIRDKKGFYQNFVSDTIAAFEDAGARLYNEAILVTAVGSLPIRISKQFQSGRKLGKTHQNVLLFYKGDPKTIKDEFGTIEAGDMIDGIKD